MALVGWDDNQGTYGVWFLRNSWGIRWGEDGYMRIEYGVNKVEYEVTYIDYPARTNIEISGGLLGASVGFRNIWNTTTTSVEWNIDVKGGIFKLIDISLQGRLESIEPGMIAYKNISLFGFGPVSIFVTAVPKNAGKIANYAKGFLWGSLFIPQYQ